jgi:hypothetical protein
MQKMPLSARWVVFLVSVMTLVSGGITRHAFAQASGPDSEERKPRQFGNFALRSDLEIGGSVLDLRGSKEKYRTDINLSSGGHLQNLYLDLRPQEGKTSWFDVALLRGQGFGDVDPFQTLNFTLRRYEKFDFRLDYSRDIYFFNVPGFDLGLHSDDNIRRNLGFGLDLYLSRNFKLRLGYAEIKRSGNSFSSADIFEDVFRLLVFNRRRTDDYRVGFDWQRSSLSVSFDQRWRGYRFDDRQGNVTAGQPGLNPNETVTLDDYRQDLPTRGRLPASALTFTYRPSSRFDAVGRYEYSKGNIDFSRSELQLLRLNPGNMSLEQLALSQATTDQPQHRLDMNASLEILPRLTLHNNANLNRYQVLSDGFTQQIFRNPTTQVGFEGTTPASEFMKYSRVSDEASLEVEVTQVVDAFAGYRYADRDVNFRSLIDDQNVSTHNSTALQSVVTGVSTSSGRGWRISLEFEHGWANNVLLRIEPLRFNRWTARGTLKPGAGVQISGSLGIRDDDNNTPGVQHEFDNREFSLQLQWLPKGAYLFELGYGRMDILSATDILFFLAGNQQQAVSRYVTNTNLGNAFVQVPLHKRVRLQLGYRLLNDSGGTFPVVFHQADAGLSMNVASGVWFNLGWRYFDYNEDFYSQQDYAGNLFSMSMRFGF